MLASGRILGGGLLALAAAIAAWPAAQDPERARPAPPPAGARPLPPVQEPFVAPVPRNDLPGRSTPRDPIEGFWQLRARMAGGRLEAAGRGYMAIGRGHLLVSLLSPGVMAGIPLLRSGAYAWQRTQGEDSVRTTVLAGHFNDIDGDVHIEPQGTIEVRRFQLLADALRVHQGGGDWLEFVRVE